MAEYMAQSKIVTTEVEHIQSGTSNDVLVAHRLIVVSHIHKIGACIVYLLRNYEETVLFQLGGELAEAGPEDYMEQLLSARLDARELDLALLSWPELTNNLESGEQIGGTRGEEVGVLWGIGVDVMAEESPGLAGSKRGIESSVPWILAEDGRVDPASVASFDPENATINNTIVLLLQEAQSTNICTFHYGRDVQSSLGKRLWIVQPTVTEKRMGENGAYMCI